ncbi:TPA: FecR domain-containing protein [Stenotrophomonas maltophilia]|uniref:FecR family protein n=1 Tax=Stenotrophomonas maltophilia TaxID=40324 RepID=UPI00066D0B4D|nr:FecR domain-containing protein [Stenotrophomonas maltophilia]MBC9115007.1 LysM peptidoglycan-binding domain-containing protein [Stenotrophomonas maltophilia]MBH1464190.1 FecR domain-containing protein [Stenotrophomonas maltophilia]MBH1614473.1 FecR domain-containing protein [Stenotrophomonas maltophilia]MBN5168969.1 FecR domain-containing protein [Stenotrophomonas maltophilia]HEL3008436.1 FecR domain-containing protein [Stenotrophomonas maltophilia]
MTFVRSLLFAMRFQGALLCALLLLPAIAAAQDWNYRVRPGDTLWDLGGVYLKPSVRWQQLQQHNRIDNPYRLPPGQLLRFPISWLRIEPAPARVLSVRGKVELSSGDGSASRAIQAGEQLHIGDTVQTEGESSVTLEFADASRLQLREYSRLRLDQLSRYGHTGMVDTRLRLQQGRASNRVTPARGPASRYIIDAPTATSSVRGTVFRVSAGDGRDAAATEVLQGKVQVGNAHGQRMVQPGQATRSASADAAPDAVTVLLPAPQLRNDELRLAPLPTLLAWTPVTGAAHYRVEVVEAATPEILLFAATTPDTRLAIGNLPPGQLRILLRAVDAQGVEGIDASADFELSDQPPPPLTLAPLHGQTINSDRPRFRWSQAPGARSSVLQIAADSTFVQPLQEQTSTGTDLRLAQPLPPGHYFWRIASRGADGHQGRYGQALPLQLSNEPVDPALQPPEAAHGELTLRWQAGSDGQRYRVQVDRRGDFKAPLVDETVAEPQVSFKRPWRGTLHVRVQYIDDDGHAGEFSPAQQIALPCRLCYGTGGGALLLWLLL